MNSKVSRIIALVWVFLFILFALAQYNDPDPILWMGMYLVASFASLLYYLKRYFLLLYLILGLAYLGGSVFFWPAEWHGIWLNESVKLHVEHARESLGLGICALIMFYYTWAGRIVRT